MTVEKLYKILEVAVKLGGYGDREVLVDSIVFDKPYPVIGGEILSSEDFCEEDIESGKAQINGLGQFVLFLD